MFVEFDYSAYHPRIIAKMIDYTFESGNPYDEIPKEVMFQNLYGGIRDEYAWFPFFNKLNAFLFEKYKTTAQFKLLNFDFTISNFKFIFFWEWFHRLWARSIGLVFAFGFIFI